MSERPSDENRTNRLSDIVVEEVSLVDRAANKHRFLIVKRSDDMNESSSELTAGGVENAKDQQELESNVEEDSSNRSVDSAQEPTDSESNSSMLAVAVESLEALTEVVDRLGTLGEEAARPMLAELAGELRSTSENLSSVVANPLGVDTNTPTSHPISREASNGAKDGTTFTNQIEAVRSTLQRVGSLLEGASPSAQGDEVAERNKEPTVTRDTVLRDQLAELTGELRTLSGLVKGQQRRLSQLLPQRLVFFTPR